MSFLVAGLASTAIVLASPFMGQLQSFLRRSLSTRNYVLLFGVGVVVSIVAAILVAFLSIRERRAERFALLAIALVFGGTYMWATSTPYPEVNAVERVHFVEYGLIAFLFYRAGLPRRSSGAGGRETADGSIIVLPLLASFAVGTCDEWLQWFIPVRVGEAHDVFLNLAAIVCGLLFGLALRPPAAFSPRLHADSWRRIAIVATTVWLIFATFVSQVHLGHVVEIEAVGRFKSHYTADELNDLQGHRAASWQTRPPLTLRRLSQEDQYLDEGLWHVRRRNLSELSEAWRENLILERFFAPVLDTATYASPDGNRWPAEQRADAAARAVPIPSFISTAEPYPILDWPQTRYWGCVWAIATVLFGLPVVVSRRQRARAITPASSSY
jgi:hypothetical protein